MKFADAGLIGAVLVLSAGLSGCGEDEAVKPPPDKPKATKAAKAATKAAPPRAVKASAAATSTAAEASRVPKAAPAAALAAAVGTNASASSMTPASSTASSAAGKTTSDETVSSNSSGTSSSSLGGGYGYGSGIGGYGSGLGQTTTIPKTDTDVSTNVKSALLAKAKTLSTHLLVSDLSYTTRDGKQQKFDAYLPTNYASASTSPYAFVVHGGDWSDGAKEDVRLYAIALAQKGIVAIAPTYRLAPTNVHPAQVNDLADVMAYIQTNPTVLFTTGTDYGAVGVATGGQLASLVALSPNASGRLKCVSAVFAPTDLTNLPLMDSAIKTYLGQTHTPAEVMAVSPVYQVSQRVGSPSFYFSHGTADSRVPYGQSETFAAELQRAGLKSTLKPVSGADHAYTEEQTRTVATEIATFTASCLGT